MTPLVGQVSERSGRMNDHRGGLAESLEGSQISPRFALGDFLHVVVLAAD